MAQCFGALVSLTEDLGLIPSTYRPANNVCHFNSRGSDVIFRPPRAPCMHAVHRLTCSQTLTHKLMITKQHKIKAENKTKMAFSVHAVSECFLRIHNLPESFGGHLGDRGGHISCKFLPTQQLRRKGLLLRH